jgi:Putative protein-S-isoprenylcysteine methyltransferase
MGEISENGDRMLERSNAASGARIEGVGFKIGAPAVLYIAVAALISYAYSPAFDIPGTSHLWTFVAGCTLLVVGLALFALSVRHLLNAFLSDTLATEGPFAVVRNPMYAIGIVFLAPGVALVIGSWLALLAPIFTFLLFRLYIREEEAYLREKFGEAYEEYRKQVLIGFF